MKKLSALIVFTLVVTAGYYIGNAVAKNTASPAQPSSDGVLTVEEAYGVVVPMQGNGSGATASQASVPPAAEQNAASDADDDNTAGNGTVTVEETVEEEGYIAQ